LATYSRGIPGLKTWGTLSVVNHIFPGLKTWGTSDCRADIKFLSPQMSIGYFALLSRHDIAGRMVQ
jgi:hypothetical protein